MITRRGNGRKQDEEEIPSDDCRLILPLDSLGEFALLSLVS